MRRKKCGNKCKNLVGKFNVNGFSLLNLGDPTAREVGKKKEEDFMRKLSLLVMVLAIASICNAYPLYDIDWEGDTVGATPPIATYVAGTPSDGVQKIVVGANSSLLVQNGYTDSVTGQTLGSKVAVASDAAGQEARFDLRGEADAISSGSFSWSWDMLSDTYSGNIYMELKNNTGHNMGTILFYQDQSDIASPIEIQLGSYTAPHGTRTDAFMAGMFTSRGTPIHVDVDLDLDTRAVDVTLTSATESVSGSLLLPFSGTSGFADDIGRLYFRTTGGDVSVVAYDNIVTTPEPTTMVLLGLGGLLIRRKK